MLFAFVYDFKKLFIRIVGLLLLCAIKLKCSYPIVVNQLLQSIQRTTGVCCSRLMFEQRHLVMKMIYHNYVAVKRIDHIRNLRPGLL
jgi:hypothetical protein